ncbi:transcriptional regulator PpsR [Rhizobium sp. AAP43]|uniref:transcriptional regulator PpsR n=1 Tax=Rhizobium sp. AAP43 TaxID=1523420 RepID=UPI0006BA009D|nr:transcriptional regulator PpsR [Rhizobium sp. AAP43]
MKPPNGHSEATGFMVADHLFHTLDPDSIVALVGLGADIVLLVDDSGTVSKVHLPNKDLAEYRLSDMVGKQLQDCVTIESVAKINSMLNKGTANHPARGYQVNHPLSKKNDLPIIYSAFSYKGSPFTIVVGRDMRQQMMDQQRLVQTQMELEADYRELQEAETRYRTAFKIATTASVMVDGEKRTVLEANAAATALLSTNGNAIVGKPLREMFHKQDRDRLGDGVSEARHNPDPVQLDGLKSAKNEEVSATIRAYRENGITNLILTLWPSSATEETQRHRPEPQKGRATIDLADLPEAVVQTDADGKVTAANTLFLDLIHAPTLNQVVGRNIATWFINAAIDLRVLYSRLSDEHVVRGFSSTLTDNLSGDRAVQISARLSQEQASVQLVITPQTTTVERLTIPSPGVPDQAEGFSSLVGKVPLKDLMRESLDVIEKICIEAALDQTNNNRAYAAEILGLSRQSLYIKLRRHGLEDYRPRS